MINKQELLELLEKEREQAAKFNLPQMALGIAQSIKIIENMEDNNMKKTIKRLSITLIAIFTLLGAGATAAYASGYINWKGTPEFNQAKDNLLQVSTRINKIKSDRDNAKQEVKDKEQTIKDKEQALRDKDKALAEKDKEKDRAVAEKQAEVDRKQKEVDEKQKEIERKQKEIEELQKNQASQAELEQAYKDMKELEELTSGLLEEVEE